MINTKHFATFSIIGVSARMGIVANSGMKTVQGVSKPRIVQTGFADSNTVKNGSHKKPKV